MARSFKARQSGGTNPQTPPNWTEMVPHKYCGAMDLGRVGKDNKAQKCAACLTVKAQMDGANDRATKRRREEKMSFALGYD